MTKYRLMLAVAGATAISTTVATAPAASKNPPRTTTVAVISTVDYRAWVITHKTSADPRNGRVTVEIETRVAGSWTPPAVHALRGVYFWNTLRGPHSLCQLEPKRQASLTDPVLLVRLLVSPGSRLRSGPVISTRDAMRSGQTRP